MGHNISGIAINKNFENNTEELSKLLGVELQIENEIIFEDASENWKEEGYFDVYFSKNGTLILPFIRIIPFKNLLQFGEYDFDFIFEATNKNEKIDYKKFGITQRFYYYDK